MSSPDVRGVAKIRGHGDPHDPLLRAKITRPDLPAWAVIRPRIDKLISEGVRGPLTSITGPPGAGKTMAIVGWAASTRDPCTMAWLTVDDYDNRPRLFWPYFVAALRLAGIAVPRVMPGRSRAAVDHVFLARLASVLAAQDLPVVMVLDDLHLLTEPALLDGISYLLRNAGSRLHLVAASRADPLLPLHRYRAAGQLTEVRADDLAFNGQESGLLMAHHGVTLAAPMLERITGRTEGWAAGMRLAALSLQTRDDAEQFVKELGTGDSEITSYLVAEVLNAQPAAVRDMLLRTSALERFSADLACELTDDPRWVDALPALARANAFVHPLGQGWYRYHSLFGTVLRLNLRIECRGQLADLYQRAARWCQRNGRLGEAVRYAAESGDWPFAARLVVDEFAIGQLIEPRGHQPLAEALKDMPRDKAWTQPEPLLVQAATLLYHGEGEAYADPLDAAESIIEHLPADDHVPARLAAALIRLTLARRTGDFEAAMAASGRAQALAGQLPEEVHASHPEVQAQVLAARGVMELWAGRLDEAAVSLAEGAAVPGCQAAHERAGCLGYLALAEALDGRLSRATEWAERAAKEIGSGSDDLTEHLISGAAVALAWVFLQQGDMREAHVQLKLAETALRTCPDKLVSALACVVAAQRGVVGGQARAAVGMIRRAREEWSPSPPRWLEIKLAVLESRAWTAAGDAPAAVAAAQRAGSGPEAATALAHARLAAGDELAARCVLGMESAESLALGVALADARLSYGIGDGARGRRCLEHALRLAKPELLRLPFAMERTWLRQVLQRDPDLTGAYHELLEPDVINPGMVPLQKKLSLPAQATPLVIERLSARELEVLTHASGMLSTAEIATEMYLSVNTVKTHLRSIYRKLSASHRGEAVRRAQQLQLL